MSVTTQAHTLQEYLDQATPMLMEIPGLSELLHADGDSYDELRSHAEVKELQRVRAAKKAGKPRKKRAKKTVEPTLLEQDDTFFFIAGYTSGGAPYGVTWEEMGLEPWENME